MLHPFSSDRRVVGLATLALLGLLAPPLRAGKVETWRQDTAAAFGRAKKERVVVADSGRVRLGHALRPAGSLEATRVWDLARAADGSIYAATGDAGKVFRRPAEGGDWAVAHDSDDTQVFSLAALPDGRVYGGTGPGGQVIEVTGKDKAPSRPDPAVQYIWDLAADAAGNLYAATGPAGQLWKRSVDGKWSKLLDSRHPHLLCVAVAPDGSIYAGSDGAGLIYRVRPDATASVVYDAPQDEVRALLVAPDGTLYAGTAAAEGGGPGTPRGLAAVDVEESRPRAATAPMATGSGPLLPGEAGPGRAGQRQIVRAEAVRPMTQRPSVVRALLATQDRPKRNAADPPGGTAAPKPPSSGENAVYRIGADGAAREVFRGRVLVFALAWRDDRLLIGTGPEGQLFEVRGRETTPISRLDSGQILALLAEPKGLLIGTGDPGSVLSLADTYAESGILTSDVLDTRLMSRFGALSWQAETPGGTALALQVRTGNVGEPDETWSAWSAPQDQPDATRPQVPPGRFAQYRALFKTGEPAASPELRSVRWRYQTVNLAPELTRIDVPDVSDGDGATRQVQLNLKWDASDPNGDDLHYALAIRKESWPDWVVLGDRPLTEKSYSWDTAAVPAGVYRVRITASDRPSNAPEDALERQLTSEPFLVDHQAPGISLQRDGRVVSVTLKDELTRLVRASYSLDGGEWTPVFPGDGLFDAKAESVPIELPELKAGTHVLMVRATDAAGNSGTGDLVFRLP